MLYVMSRSVSNRYERQVLQGSLYADTMLEKPSQAFVDKQNLPHWHSKICQNNRQKYVAKSWKLEHRDHHGVWHDKKSAQVIQEKEDLLSKTGHILRRLSSHATSSIRPR